MKLGVSRWDELGSLDGNVLVFVNSHPVETERVEAFFAQLASVVAPAHTFVVAEPEWQPLLSRLNLVGGNILLAADSAGARLELTHFLQTPIVMQWAIPRQFRLIVGTAAHSLYNEEVKNLLEERMLLVNDGAWFMAHALPSPYLYLLDGAELLERVARPSKLSEYQTASRLIVENLYQRWISGGQPHSEPAVAATAAIMFDHLPSSISPRNEIHADPARREVPGPVLDLVHRFRQIVIEHDRWLSIAESRSHAAERQAEGQVRELESQLQAHANELDVHREFLASVQAERDESVNVRDRLLDEARTTQGLVIGARDKIIDDLRVRVRPWPRRLLRWVLKRTRR